MKDNIIQTFQLEESALRGRSVKIGSVLDEMLIPHDYPKPVAHLLAESMTLTLLLSSMLKYEGIFTLQASGDGPVSMLMSDVTSEGVIRGYAGFDEERLERAREQLSSLKSTGDGRNHLAQYLGSGHLAFTVDQEGNTDRYQGIVELHGSSLIDCVHHYFVQSEQIRTGIKIACGQRDGGWRAGGILLQHFPEEERKKNNSHEDDWRRCMLLLDTCTEEELLEVGLASHDLVHRLYHEEGVRVFEPKPIQKGCRCSFEKVESIIKMMSQEDIEDVEKDGKITMTCEFCRTDYTFDVPKI